MYNIFKFIKLCEVPRSFRKVSACMTLTKILFEFRWKTSGYVGVSVCYSCYGCVLKEPFPRYPAEKFFSHAPIVGSEFQIVLGSFCWNQFPTVFLTDSGGLRGQSGGM